MSENMTALNEFELDGITGGNAGANEGMHSGALKMKKATAIYKGMKAVSKNKLGTIAKGKLVMGAVYCGASNGCDWYRVPAQAGVSQTGYIQAEYVKVM